MTRALLFDVNHSLFGSLETCDSPTIPFFFIFYSFVSVGMSCLASKDEWHLVNVFHLFKAETIFFLRSAIFPLFSLYFISGYYLGGASKLVGCVFERGVLNGSYFSVHALCTCIWSLSEAWSGLCACHWLVASIHPHSASLASTSSTVLLRTFYKECKWFWKAQSKQK